MDTVARDVKQTFRQLAANRGFAAAALLTIALSVGGTSAVFSVVYAILLHPLPYPEPDRLVRLWEMHPGGRAPIPGPALSGPTYRAWSQSSGQPPGDRGVPQQRLHRELRRHCAAPTRHARHPVAVSCASCVAAHGPLLP